MTQDVSKESVNEAVVADLDTMTATKETLEDYTLRSRARSWPKASSSDWVSRCGWATRIDADHLPVGHLRHESAFHAAGLDYSALAGPHGGTVRLSRRHPP